MSKKQEGIKPSRKYANGTIHENASGRFTVLDRFLGKDGIIYMKIQWLSTGKIETNKEVNISASIWKFDKAHGKVNPPEEQEPLPEITLQDLYEVVTENREFQEDRLNHFMEHMEQIHEKVVSQADTIEQLLRKLEIAFKEIGELNRKYDLSEKLIDKM